MLDDEALATMWRAGREAWPEIELGLPAFAAFVRPRATDVEGLHAADMFIACACAGRVPGALDTFERTFARDIDGVGRRRGPAGEENDVGQIVRERLFVSTPERPAKIHLYSGRAPLRYWLRAVAAEDVDSHQGQFFSLAKHLQGVHPKLAVRVAGAGDDRCVVECIAAMQDPKGVHSRAHG